ncbi:MAG TPA: BamA/TamA family outer membrane protein [Burkholderiaceae bacterium]
MPTAPHGPLSRRRGPAAPLLVLLMAALAGCGGLSRMLGDKPAAATDVASADAPVAYGLEVRAPDDVRKLLATHLDLARFQRLEGNDRVTLADLNRIIQAAPAQARALLETEGYFNPVVRARRENTGGGAAPLVVVEVDPGPRTTVGQVQIDVRGDLQSAQAAGQPAATALVLRLRQEWQLGAGKPFRQGGWSDAKNATLARARADGYAAAGWGSTRAQVDAPSNSARLELQLDSGPLFHFGALKPEGLQRYNRAAIDNLATFGNGTPYSEKLLLDFQERLQRANLFESAVVEIDADPAQAAASPVAVRVKELPKNQAEVGVGYSDSTGQRVSVEHLNRRFLDRSFFGTDLIARNKLELGRDRQSLESSLLTHPLTGANRYLLSAKLQRETLAGATVRSASLRAGRTFESERIDRLVFAEVLSASTNSAGGNRRDRSLTGNYHFTWRDLDSTLLPTRGQALHAEAAAGYAVSDVAISGPFARGLARLTAYRPLGGAWLGSARIEAARVFAQSGVGVPDTLLFRAGGDDSVRGYSFQSLGPVVNGAVSSGRVLVAGSVEATRPLLESFPTLLGAVFIDAGAAANQWNALDPVLGYGVGLRLRSPVGPLRVDVAYGQAVHEFRLHFGVGITF